MRSIGIDLQPWVEANLLHFRADRPSRAGLEAHLASVYQHVRDFKPSVTIVDAVTNLLSVGTQNDVRAMLMRVIDYLKVDGVTGFFTNLLPHGYLDRDDLRRSEQAAPPCDSDSEVARHGAFEPRP
jgi:circadian clock protein KaiC